MLEGYEHYHCMSGTHLPITIGPLYLPPVQVLLHEALHRWMHKGIIRLKNLAVDFTTSIPLFT